MFDSESDSDGSEAQEAKVLCSDHVVRLNRGTQTRKVELGEETDAQELTLESLRIKVGFLQRREEHHVAKLRKRIAELIQSNEQKSEEMKQFTEQYIKWQQKYNDMLKNRHFLTTGSYPEYQFHYQSTGVDSDASHGSPAHAHSQRQGGEQGRRGVGFGSMLGGGGGTGGRAQMMTDMRYRSDREASDAIKAQLTRIIAAKDEELGQLAEDLENTQKEVRKGAGRIARLQTEIGTWAEVLLELCTQQEQGCSEALEWLTVEKKIPREIFLGASVQRLSSLALNMYHSLRKGQCLSKENAIRQRMAGLQIRIETMLKKLLSVPPLMTPAALEVLNGARSSASAPQEEKEGRHNSARSSVSPDDEEEESDLDLESMLETSAEQSASGRIEAEFSEILRKLSDIKQLGTFSKQLKIPFLDTSAGADLRPRAVGSIPPASSRVANSRPSSGSPFPQTLQAPGGGPSGASTPRSARSSPPSLPLDISPEELASSLNTARNSSRETDRRQSSARGMAGGDPGGGKVSSLRSPNLEAADLGEAMPNTSRTLDTGRSETSLAPALSARAATAGASPLLSPTEGGSGLMLNLDQFTKEPDSMAGGGDFRRVLLAVESVCQEANQRLGEQEHRLPGGVSLPPEPSPLPPTDSARKTEQVHTARGSRLKVSGGTPSSSMRRSSTASPSHRPVSAGSTSSDDSAPQNRVVGAVRTVTDRLLGTIKALLDFTASQQRDVDFWMGKFNEATGGGRSGSTVAVTKPPLPLPSVRGRPSAVRGAARRKSSVSTAGPAESGASAVEPTEFRFPPAAGGRTSSMGSSLSSVVGAAGARGVSTASTQVAAEPPGPPLATLDFTAVVPSCVISLPPSGVVSVPEIELLRQHLKEAPDGDVPWFVVNVPSSSYQRPSLAPSSPKLGAREAGSVVDPVFGLPADNSGPSRKPSAQGRGSVSPQDSASATARKVSFGVIPDLKFTAPHGKEDDADESVEHPGLREGGWSTAEPGADSLPTASLGSLSPSRGSVGGPPPFDGDVVLAIPRGSVVAPSPREESARHSSRSSVGATARRNGPGRASGAGLSIPNGSGSKASSPVAPPQSKVVIIEGAVQSNVIPATARRGSSSRGPFSMASKDSQPARADKSTQCGTRDAALDRYFTSAGSGAMAALGGSESPTNSPTHRSIHLDRSVTTCTTQTDILETQELGAQTAFPYSGVIQHEGWLEVQSIALPRAVMAGTPYVVLAGPWLHLYDSPVEWNLLASVNLCGATLSSFVPSQQLLEVTVPGMAGVISLYARCFPEFAEWLKHISAAMESYRGLQSQDGPKAEVSSGSGIPSIISKTIALICSSILHALDPGHKVVYPATPAASDARVLDAWQGEIKALVRTWLAVITRLKKPDARAAVFIEDLCLISTLTAASLKEDGVTRGSSRPQEPTSRATQTPSGSSPRSTTVGSGASPGNSVAASPQAATHETLEITPTDPDPSALALMRRPVVGLTPQLAFPLGHRTLRPSKKKGMLRSSSSSKAGGTPPGEGLPMLPVVPMRSGSKEHERARQKELELELQRFLLLAPPPSSTPLSTGNSVGLGRAQEAPEEGPPPEPTPAPHRTASPRSSLRGPTKRSGSPPGAKARRVTTETVRLPQAIGGGPTPPPTSTVEEELAALCGTLTTRSLQGGGGKPSFPLVPRPVTAPVPLGVAPLDYLSTPSAVEKLIVAPSSSRGGGLAVSTLTFLPDPYLSAQRKEVLGNFDACHGILAGPSPSQTTQALLGRTSTGVPSSPYQPQGHVPAYKQRAVEKFLAEKFATPVGRYDPVVRRDDFSDLAIDAMVEAMAPSGEAENVSLAGAAVLEMS
eukprot:RCo020090